MPKGVAKDPSKDKRRRWKGKACPQRKNNKGKLDSLAKMENDSRTHTLEEKREAALQYALCGTYLGAAKRCSFPVHDATIGGWAKTDWWQDLQQEIADELEDKIRAQYNQILDKAHTETLDRLENGDVIFDSKRGQQVRVPIKGKDAMTIGAIAYDKKRISLNMPTSITAQSGTKQMEDLAKQFANLARNFEYRQVRQDKSLPGEYQVEED